ncbi:MAG: FprA family A-type flavoprotein [Oscillospiraceae bacterium]|nr:FprA family A-type flavoprotein [Oscillospiraceae bacterium]
MNISKDIIYVGVNDHDIDLFEGQYVVPLGMAYNSYVIVDEKIAVMDTVDARFGDEWLTNIDAVLCGRTPDYLIVQHMEPDHSANIKKFVEKYPNVSVVGNSKTFNMIANFFPDFEISAKTEVKNGETLSLGKHNLTFVFAPMVHWPEVMMTYDDCDKVLFSADGFGKFGANDVEDPEGWDCEARRYYFGIVGKYGAQVQAVLKKAAALDIQVIAPLHGPVLTENIGYYVNKYDTWSSYKPEDEGVSIAYCSIYGNTKKAAEMLYDKLVAKGVEVKIADLAREDIPEAIENAFRFSKLVIAAPTYNADVFPFMRTFLEGLAERGYRNRTIGIIENGSWAPMAAKVMKGILEKCKNITYLENTCKITSAVKESNIAELDAMVEEICK